MEEEPPKKLNQFFSKFKSLIFKKGETIIRPDDEPYSVFYLKKGYTRLYSLSKNAQELTLIIFQPDDFFPMMRTINVNPNIYYLEAMTAVEVYRAPREEFLKFIRSNNDVLFEIVSHILIRLGGVLNRMEYAIFGNASNKVASIIQICAERFGIPGKRGIIIQVPLTHQDIAKLIGIARETVSIEMKKLQNMGLISYQGRLLVVKNMINLQKESLVEHNSLGG